MATNLPQTVDNLVVGERPEIEADKMIKLYTVMSRIRAFETEVIDAFKAGLIPGSTHPCIGQEAIKAGVVYAIQRSDLVLATYRGHGEAIALGSDPAAVMAEIMCRTTGLCNGKGGSMHLSDPDVGLLGTNAIVAGHIPIAGGVALSCKLRKTGQVVVAMFGDGAACEGEFFETLNMAQLWKVPLVLVCENNGTAISVPTTKSQATPDIADRATGVGMPSQIVDGNDVFAVLDAVSNAARHAHDGLGPAFVECKTVRWERHSAFSAGGTDVEVAREAWQRVDPLLRLRKQLRAWEVASVEGLDSIDARAMGEASAARTAAEAAPKPTPESVYEYLFAPVE